MTTIVSKPRTTVWRALVYYAVLAFSVLGIVNKLVTMQIVQGDRWRIQAEDNRTDTIIVPTTRGIIYDRNLSILASNAPSYNIVITPANLPDEEGDIQRIYRELSALTGIPVSNGTIDDAKLVSECTAGPGINELVELGNSNAPYRPVPIACYVDEKMAMTVRERAMDWPGVTVKVDQIRSYPTGETSANIIGFLGPIPASQAKLYEDLNFVANRDKVGYSGVESYFDEILIGRNGKRVIEVDVAGQELRNVEAPIPAEPGKNLVLTIDTRLQRATEAALIGEIQSWTARSDRIKITSGTVIAMNPKTGEILAMASYPSFENNRMARVIPGYYYRQLAEDPRKPMLNHAISDEYPPGSVFKLSTAIGALNEGVISLDQIIDAPGEIVLTESYNPNDPGNEQSFVDWIAKSRPEGFGTIDFWHCIAYSSNVCFYKLGGGFKEEVKEGLGIERLREYARALGYDQLSGIELPGEADGMIPTPKWKRIRQGQNWSTGDTYLASVGQGYVLSTPLQVLQSAATIANNGKRMKPTIIHEVVDNEGKVLEYWYNEFANGYYSITPHQDLTAVSSRKISPFTPTMINDITKDPIIEDYYCEDSYCTPTGKKKSVDPFVIKNVQQGMRLAITDQIFGTLNGIFVRSNEFVGDFTKPFALSVAGKTGTAEYCDNVAQSLNRCNRGAWPAHSWTVAYAPFEDPEIVVVAFAYNGNEGSSVAGPMVRLVLEAYFGLKAIDQGEAK